MISGKFQEAKDIAEGWLRSFPLQEKESPDYKRAQEAFLYARFFLHRQERVQAMPKGENRARTYLQFLEELKEVRREKGFDLEPSPFWKVLSKYIHLQIAEGFAKAFAGQKSYHLNDAEIIQLAVSLLVLERWSAALDALLFLQRLQPTNWPARYLIAIASFHLKKERDFSTSMRDALFYKPEILKQHGDFLPPGVFKKLWERQLEEDQDDDLAPRKYALLLEINGLYPFKRALQKNELRHIEEEFEGEYKTYRSDRVYHEEKLPLLLHNLCWLAYSYKTSGDYEKFEEYRQIMMELSPDSWELFQKKNLAE